MYQNENSKGIFKHKKNIVFLIKFIYNFIDYKL